jgi:putative SOS response-associated peptidase YedK
MCTRYISPETAAIERHWHVGRQQPWRGVEGPVDVFPGYQGTFIRAAAMSASNDETNPPMPELVTGQWNLIPWFATTAKLKFATCNARSEEMAAKASYKLPWARGQRCIIPAAAFFEPNWETGKHVRWRFKRSDGTPWGLAGLGNTWVDKTTGEIVESYTMLTLNADAHPLMNRMHKPDPKLAVNAQDKRSVVPIEMADVNTWLYGSQAEAKGLIRLTDVDGFEAVVEG